MPSRNITLSLPDDLIRQAKVLAAQRETSISALVGELLAQLLGTDDYDSAWAREEAVMAEGALRIGALGWDRNELHER